MLRTADHHMVILLEFRQTVAVGDALLLALQLMARLAAHLHATLVIDLYLLVMQHMLGPVPLGAQVDLFGALAVLDTQFVIASTARAALATPETAGLVRWQVEGHWRGGVGQAPHHQRHVHVAIDEPHQHFHAHPGDQHHTITVMGPATGYPQPATGMVVVLAGTIPGQLHLDPAVFVTVDFTVDRAGDHRALIPRYRWARLLRQRRTKHRIPWRGDKCVAIALAQFPSVLLGDRLLQHLGLLAFMAHLRHQPQVIPVLAGVLTQLQKPATGQRRLIALAVGTAIVAAVPLQATLGEIFAMGAVGKVTGVVLRFKLGQ